MTEADEPTLQELDEQLRELEVHGSRDSDEFRRLSNQREKLLNARDDDA